MNTPFFSIIIPVYKVEKYIHCCIDSILKQDFKDYEIILIDDGSPDGCPQICDAYKERFSNVKVVHKHNMGLSEARNDGIRIAKGKYVIFLDSDDYHNNIHFLSIVYQKLCNNPIEILLFQRCRFTDGTNKNTRPKPFAKSEINETHIGILLRRLAQHDRLDANASLKVLSKSFLIREQLLFEKGIYSEDVEWFIRVLLSAKSIAVSNVLSYCYRLRDGSISHSVSKKHIDDLFFIVDKYSEKVLKFNDSNKKSAILNLLCYYYFIVLGFSDAYLKGDEKSVYIQKCKKYVWLTDYALNNKTRLCSLLLRVLGIKHTAWIISSYILNRK